MKKYRGITLISLVITIIILLILAGISIIGLFGSNGLITNAINVATEHKKQAYFEDIKMEIMNEQTERIEEPKEELFIKSLKERIKNKHWTNTDNVIMCKEIETRFEEQEKEEDNTVLVIDTNDNYEIIIDIDNVGLQAIIRENNFKKIKKCKIKFNLNGGTGETPEEKEVKKDFNIKLPQGEYTKTGYEFAGWNKDKNAISGELGGSKYKITESETLYAIWTKNTVTLTFDENGGTGTMNVATITPNQETTLPENAYAKTGYSFVKWNTEQDGTGTDYLNGSKITLGENTTLYAQWEQSITATISINNNKKLTEGTTITVGGTAYSSDISKVEITIGNKTVYTEDVTDSKTYSKIISIDSLSNIGELIFWETYDAKLKITSSSGISSEGKITDVRNSTIGSAVSLNKLATEVNNGATFDGELLYQISDIVANNNYIPIGYYDATSSWEGPFFAGTFEGNNHKITLNSLSKDLKYKSSGIFGMMIGGTLKNVEANGTNDGKSEYIGIVGAIKDGSIINCTNKCNIADTNNESRGGIAGIAKNTQINNCHNYATILGSTNIGGICGYATLNSNIIDCENLGNIGNYGYSEVKWRERGSEQISQYGVLGGIVGNIDNNSKIEKCKNNGIVIGNENSQFYGVLNGGIVGMASNATISKCQNNVKVQYYQTNSGTTVNGGGLGGIIGLAQNITITESFNKGIVTSQYLNGNKCMNNVGGIVGYMCTETLKNCYNTGEVTGVKRVGGISGYAKIAENNENNYINNCYNASENINGNSNVGNFIGVSINSIGTNNSYIKNVTNIGSSTNDNWTNNIAYTVSEMKTQSGLLNLMNSGDGTGLWQKNNDINNGYPYLINNV